MCKSIIKRSRFLLTLNADGSIMDDLQGGLRGSCADCAGEEFTKQEAERRMKLRTDLKLRDLKRLRCQTYEETMAKVGLEAEQQGKSNTWIRTQTRALLKQICEDIATEFATAFPEAFKNIRDRYWKAKKAEVSAATMASSSSSHTGPRPEGTEEEDGEYVTRLDALTVVKGVDKVQAYQLLSDITASVSRYFVCRNPDCSPEGAFCSLNMFWMSTAFGPDGKAHSGTGWSWACPNCGRIYNPKST